MPRLREFTLIVGDLRPELDFLVTDGDGTAINLTGMTARFLMALIDDNGDMTNVIDDDATVVAPATDGRLRYSWQDGDTDQVGRYVASFEVLNGDYKFSVPNDDYIYVRVLPRLTIA